MGQIDKNVGSTVTLVRPWSRDARRLGGLPRRAALILSVLLILGARALWSIIDPVMELIYFERAPDFLNGLISNRDVHNLARYQDDARLLLGPPVRDTLVAAGLLMLYAFVHIDLAELKRRHRFENTSIGDLFRGLWSQNIRLGNAEIFMLVTGGAALLALIGLTRPLLTMALVVGTFVGLKLLPGGDGRESSQRETRIHTVGVMTALALLASALVLFRIGDHDFFEDEHQVIAAAYTHSQVSTYHGWNWIDDVPGEGTPYIRAKQHTWLIARFIELFGMSEGVTRLPGAFAGILLTTLSYPMMLRATRSRGAALVASVFLLLAFLNTFRYARMYSLVVPIAFLWTFVHAEALRALRRSFAHAGLLLATSVAIGWLAYSLHVNSLSLAAAFALPTAITLHGTMRARGWSRSKLRALWLLAVVGAVPFAWQLGQRVSGLLSLFERRNFAYVDILFGTPLPSVISGLFGASLIGVSVGTMLRRRLDGISSDPFLALSLASFVFAVPFFILVANRYSGALYVAHVRVLALVLVAAGLGGLLEQMTRPQARVIIVAVFLSLATLSWASRFDSTYLGDTSYGVHSEAYEFIADGVDPATDVILGQYFRTYYAQDPNIRETLLISMGRNGSFSIDDLETALAQSDRAWITWEARKSYHLRKDVRELIRERGRQISGPGVDETRVFIYFIER